MKKKIILSFAILVFAILVIAAMAAFNMQFGFNIIEGMNKNTKLQDHPNYKHLNSLFKNIQKTEDENPVLLE